MLTRKQIERLAEEGWEIVFKKGRHPKKYSGWCLPDEKEVRVYLPAIEGIDELSITLCHELTHARGNVKRKAARSEGISEDAVEQEAKETYRRHPEIAITIARIYALDIRRYLRPLYRSVKKIRI
jgi:hypothetical protein